MIGKNLTSIAKIDTDREHIAEFMNIPYDEVLVHSAPKTYIVNIENNLDAQKAYKQRNPFGNGHRPNTFDFTQDILVRWNEDKLQAM